MQVCVSTQNYMISDVRSTQLFIHRGVKKTLSKIFLFPLFRVFIAIIFLAPAIILVNVFTIFVVENTEDPLFTILRFSKTIVLLVLLYFSYSFYTRKIEGRVAFEFDFKQWYTEFGIGALIGGGMVVLIVIVLMFPGYYEIDQINSPFLLLNRLFRYGVGSFVEDLIYTVIFFRLLEEYAGSTISIIVTSLIFGGIHFGNDNATVMSSLFISLEHLALLAPFILSRRIWMTWAVHFSWNFFQTGIFGMNNSGMAHDGFITPVIKGPDWITGGEFGLEGSWLSLLVNIVIGIIVLDRAIRDGQWVLPRWRRR